jgi:two-component system cell cycle response regulator CpdR
MSLSQITVRVLLVEDEALIQDLLKSALEDGGYDVLTAGSADEAMRLLDGIAGEIGGLISDVNLGGPTSGWDIARRARDLNPRMAVVYISGDSSYQWTSQGVPHSAVLTKPFVPAQLVVALAGLATKLDASA